jgi:DNA-binding transcriptional LysR family regulator
VNLEQIATYLTVLQTGSFHEAARRLGISQASVSQQVRKLERTAGAQLVVRDRSGCRPAARTGEFIRYATAMLALSERASRAFRRPLVSVGAASNIGVYLLPSLHRQFVEQFGDSAELSPTLGDNRAIADLLDTDAIDVALMEWWDNRSGFEARVWREEELVVIVGSNHTWTSRNAVELTELAEQPLIGGEAYSGTATLLRSHPRPSTKPLHIAMNLGSTEAVKQAVRQGLGVSIVLAATVRDEVRHGHLHTLRITGAPLRKQLLVIHRPNLLPDGPVTAFVNIVRAGTR